MNKCFVVAAAVIGLLCPANSAQADFSKIVAMPDFVPIEKVVASTGPTDFECSNFDQDTQTCTTLGQMTLENGRVTGKVNFLVNPASPRLVGVLVDTMTIEQGLGCTDSNGATMEILGEIPEDVAKGVKRITLDEARKHGKVCVAYFKEGNGFKTVTYKPDGMPLENYPIVPISFVAKQLELRMMGR